LRAWSLYRLARPFLGPARLCPARLPRCARNDITVSLRGAERRSNLAAANLRANIAGAARVFEAADRLREEVLGKPEYDVGEKNARGDRREEDHIDRQ